MKTREVESLFASGGGFCSLMSARLPGGAIGCHIGHSSRRNGQRHMQTELLQGITGRLSVELTEPTERITEALYNRRAPAAAVITSVKLEADIFEDDDYRELNEQELQTAAFAHGEIVMRGLGAPVHHRAPNGSYFTVGDLLAAVEKTERSTRHQSEWFGGVDVHHVFFEGLHLDADGVWQIGWGS